MPRDAIDRLLSPVLPHKTDMERGVIAEIVLTVLPRLVPGKRYSVECYRQVNTDE